MRDPNSPTSQPGRPREFDEGEALSKIMQLFWEHGYDATGLSDILKATGLGKASLYAAFGNKQSMYLKALGHYESLAVDGAVKALRASSLPPMQRIEAFVSAPISAVSDKDDRRGCFLCNASADRASLDEDTGELVKRGYEKMARALKDALAEAHPDRAADTLQQHAQLALTVYSGLRVMARSGMSADSLRPARDACLHAIH